MPSALSYRHFPTVCVSCGRNLDHELSLIWRQRNP